MTERDESRLLDDTWTTIDENNNREPRKLTIISELGPPKPTPEELPGETNEQCKGLVVADNPGDSCNVNPNEFQEKLYELREYTSTDFMEGHHQSQKDIQEEVALAIEVSNSNDSVVEEGIDNLGNTKATKSPLRSAVHNTKNKINFKNLNDGAASLTFDDLLPKSGMSKSKIPSHIIERSNSKSPGPKPGSAEPLKDSLKDSKNKGRSRERTFSRRNHCIQVEGRKYVGPLPADESPYACNIIELPRHRPTSKDARKIFVTNREHKLLADQISTSKKPVMPLVADDAGISPLEGGLTGQDNPSDCCMMSQAQAEFSGRVESSPLVSATVPLKSWPTFGNLHGHFLKAKETQTQEGVEYQETGQQVDFHLSPYLTPSPSPVSLLALTTDTISNQSQTDVDAVRFQSLEKLANKLEQGMFTASEALNVIIHTIFRESIGNPSAEDSVLKCFEFQEFLNSPNEIQALENVSVLLSSTSRTIEDYVKTLKSAGITFPDETSFSTKTGRANSIASIKSSKPAVKSKKSESHIWNFQSPDSSENFQLSLYLTPNAGEILQTITCQDNIFRTRYTNTEDEDHRIKNIVCASREHIGVPANINLDRLMDTIVRCSSFASTRLTAARSWISKCYKEISEISVQVSKPKYAVDATKDRNLNSLSKRLQRLNVFAGIICQLSSEMLIACTKMQTGIWKTMYVQDILKFPRIPGFPSPTSKRDCEIPSGTHVPVHEAMIQLTEGVKMIEKIYDMGQFLYSSLEFGVKSKSQYKTVIHDYLKGVKALGSNKGIDYGSLLMTLLCSAEMIKYYEEVMPATEPLVRTTIITHLSKISNGTNELKTAVQRMEADSMVLTVQTMGRLKDIRRRKSAIVDKSGFCLC